MINSFRYAFRGILDALNSEPNLKVHFTLGILVNILAIYFKFSTLEQAILIITIFMVVIMELVNTVIEKTMDIVSPEKSEKVRVVKDISAAIVLLSAICSILVGILLFVPKLFGYLF